jgi:hypothetical protein
LQKRAQAEAWKDGEKACVSRKKKRYSQILFAVYGMFGGDSLFYLRMIEISAKGIFRPKMVYL